MKDMKLCFYHCYNFLLVGVSIIQKIKNEWKIIKIIKNKLITNYNNVHKKASYFSLYIKIEPSPIQNGKELLQLNKILNKVNQGLNK